MQAQRITNRYLGDNPTTWLRPGVPHDSYLAEFLMRSNDPFRSSNATSTPSVRAVLGLLFGSHR
ncbi:hypothetical protein OIE68_10485 [Nocardia vinacea]|uniref:hypothetical protein n=1 Tax=Nocardia vinacea TaxID=96468 RepID=UPI002E1454B8|nr:hypothetical protein OIE68_10485 [Nocardia vinacea]